MGIYVPSSSPKPSLPLPSHLVSSIVPRTSGSILEQVGQSTDSSIWFGPLILPEPLP